MLNVAGSRYLAAHGDTVANIRAATVAKSCEIGAPQRLRLHLRTGQNLRALIVRGATMCALKLLKAGASTTTWQQLLLWIGLRRALVILRVL